MAIDKAIIILLVIAILIVAWKNIEGKLSEKWTTPLRIALLVVILIVIGVASNLLLN